jgi:hypothetical protein
MRNADLTLLQDRGEPFQDRIGNSELFSVPFLTCSACGWPWWSVQLQLSVIRYFEFKRDPPLAEHPADLRPEAKAAHGGGRERDEQADLASF